MNYILKFHDSLGNMPEMRERITELMTRLDINIKPFDGPILIEWARSSIHSSGLKAEISLPGCEYRPLLRLNQEDVTDAGNLSYVQGRLNGQLDKLLFWQMNRVLRQIEESYQAPVEVPA